MKVRIGLGVGILIIASLVIGCSSGVSQDKFDKVSSDLVQAQTEIENSQNNVVLLEEQLASANADLEKAQTELKASNITMAGVQSELDIMKATYPPGDFATLTELEDWVRSNTQQETQYVEEAFGAAVMTQQAALNDGYLISIDIDGPDEYDSYFVWCTAFVGNTLHYWSPELTTVTPWNLFVK